jgi:uncharacterized protein YndB with AHSA1/START domain
MSETAAETKTTITKDKIEKEILLRASRARVWRALTDAAEFGAWFGMKLGGPFVVGERVNGKVTIPGFTHLTLDLAVERMEAERLFSYRWHPYAHDPEVDYSDEPRTLVEFHLADAPGGTRLQVIESGFARLPAHRRDIAFRMNEGGWKAQLENVRKHVEG